MPNGTLYFHSACFDGLVSAVLAWVFLETKDWQFQGFIPVNYDVRTMWLSDPLKTPAAVVDFLYHPDADFWAGLDAVLSHYFYLSQRWKS